jgi:hypothetical protein
MLLWNRKEKAKEEEEKETNLELYLELSMCCSFPLGKKGNRCGSNRKRSPNPAKKN